VDRRRRVDRAGLQPVLADDLADHVGQRHVLERRAAAVAVQAMRLVVGAHGDRRRRGRELRLERDDLAREDRARVRRLDVAEHDLDLVADEERRVGDVPALGVGHADRRHVGQADVVAHLDLLDVVHVLGVEPLPRDLDRR
jgi:hypothetical protein